MSRTVAVSDDVYEFLSKLKRSDESFSDVIRSLKRRTKLSDISGSKTVTREEWQKVTKDFEKQRKLDSDRRKRLL